MRRNETTRITLLRNETIPAPERPAAQRLDPIHVFRKFAHPASLLIGSPGAFTAATAVIVIWTVTGPAFQYSDTWQLSPAKAPSLMDDALRKPGVVPTYFPR